jgi:membrane fusion protein, heavy metal efflux system
MRPRWKLTRSVRVTIAIASTILVALYATQIWGGGNAGTVSAAEAPPAGATVDGETVTLGDEQVKAVRVAPVAEHDFVPRHETVGTIDFDQDRSVPVFSPWAGRIVRVLAKAGDDVKRGDPLFTIESPDLVTAESNLIGAAAVLQLTTRTLERARALFESQTIAQKELDQAATDQQTAQGNLEAARAAVRIFGKSDAEIERIIAARSTAAELQIGSPIAGRVTARNAAPGLLVQPGSGSAPFNVADISTMWMVANVTEDELPRVHVGQSVEVSLSAYPDRKFEARVSNIGAAVDPNTHRVTVRSQIRDPSHQLRPQMMGTFVIRTGAAQRSPAVPLSGVVREGDGTMEVFVTSDGRRFVRRPVQLGLQQDGMDQVLEGLAKGEQIATDNALFVANELARQTR